MATRTFNVYTPLEDGVLELTLLDGEEGISEVFSFDLELVSRSPDIDPKDLLGAGMTIEIITQTGDSRYLNGITTSFAFLGADTSDNTFYRYQATVRSWLVLATLDCDCRIFQQKTIPQIIQETLAPFGMPLELKLSASYDTLEYVVRFNEPALVFVMRLAESVGIFWYTIHTADTHTIVFSDRTTPVLAASEIPFLTPGSRPMQSDEYITEWHIKNELQAGRYRARSFNFKNPKPLLLDLNELRPKDHSNDSIPVYEWDGSYVERAAGQKLVTVRRAQLQHNWETISAVTNVRDIAPGHTFTLKKHPRDDANREYLIVSAHYTFIENAHTTRSDSANTKTTWKIEFKARSTETPYVPQRVTPRPHITGIHTAIVTGPAGEEIYCDAYGRVKAQFIWDPYGNLDENSSCWMRVLSLLAGTHFGLAAVPRIGQEVQIQYQNGNVDFPIITGLAYNFNNMPPWDLPANATQVGILSRSTKDGHYSNANALRFEDKKGAEQVWIQAERNMDTVVEVDDAQTVGGSRTIKVGGTHTETIRKDTKVTVAEGDHSVTVSKGNQTNTVSTGKHTNTIQGDITVESKAGEYSLKSPTKITLQVGGSTIVMTPSSITLQSADIYLNTGGGAAASSPGAAPAAPLKLGLGDDVDKLAAKSPSLQNKLADLQKKGWKIQFGPAGGGSSAHRDSHPPTINIDSNEKNNPSAIVQTLAHESGHAEYPYKPDYSSKTAYVNGALADEGAATVSNIQTQREITANGGPDIGIAGNAANQPAYNAAYDQYLKTGNAQQANQTIGSIYGNGEQASVPSNGKTVSYNQYYGDWYDSAFPGKK